MDIREFFGASSSKMELATQPTQYELSLDESNNYVDKVPSTTELAQGIRCGCGSRTLFTSRQNMSIHFKTVGHQKWVEQQNKNKENHLTELLQLREVVRQQVLLIADRDQKIVKLEKNIRDKDITIRSLSAMVANAPSDQVEVNLLDIDM